MVHYIADRFGRGLRAIQELYPDWFVGIRQDGVVMGLEFDHPEGAKLVMKHLYENGVWAIFSTLDPRVLQFKPGVLMTQPLCEDLLHLLFPGFFSDEPVASEELPLAANELVATYINSKLPFEYYTRELIGSPEAKTSWVEPDLKPFDF